MTTHAELRKEMLDAAEKATPKKWKFDGDDCDPDQDDPYIYRDIPDVDRGISVLFNADWGTTEDAAYIVAAQPANIKALIEGYDQQLKTVLDREAESQRRHDAIASIERAEVETRRWLIQYKVCQNPDVWKDWSPYSDSLDVIQAQWDNLFPGEKKWYRIVQVTTIRSVVE